MSSAPFQSTEEFLQAFATFENTAYENFTPLIDRKVGFSVTRLYPVNLLFKPAIAKNGQPDSVALMHIVYVHPDESRKPVSPTKVPITIDASVHSLFLGKGHRDYDFDAQDSPSLEALEARKKSISPLPLDSLDDYHFNHETDLFYDDKGASYTGLELLDSFFEKHYKTAHRLKGFPIRLKLRWKGGLANVVGLFVGVLTWILREMFGRTLKKEMRLSGYLTGYPPDALVLLSDEVVSLFGYKASKRTVVTFSAAITAVAFLYAYLGSGRGLFLDRLFSNLVFSVSIAIFFLWLVDAQLPKLIFILLNGCIKLRAKVWFWRLKV